MEQRVQRKALLKNFRLRQQETLKSSSSKETISSKLRSMTIHNNLSRKGRLGVRDSSHEEVRAFSGTGHLVSGPYSSQKGKFLTKTSSVR